MDESRFDPSLKAFAGASGGRRDALRAVSAAGMALLAALGIAGSSDAKKNNKGGNNKNANEEHHRNRGHNRK